MSSEIDRKIAVILVADVVGYSKHMERDENATLKAYAECEKILKNCLNKYKGSIFNTAGDSVLAEFPSAVNAVECGVAFQKDIKKRNESDKTEVKLAFRIGINMGDVVKKEGNLFGDGVNIAARLEALAQPNGISISKSVYDLVVPKTKMTFNDLGVQKVKQNEFHAFDILLGPSQKRTLNTKTKSNLAVVGTILAAIIMSLFGAFYFAFNSDLRQAKVIEKSTIPVLIVYPFQNINDDKETESLGLATTESIIANLSRFKGIKVLSSSTSQAAKKLNLSDLEIKNKYAAEYVIRGSIQTFGEKSQIKIELSKIETDDVLYADKLNFKTSDFFNVQDSIGTEVLKHLQINEVVGTIGKSWAANLGSIDLFTKALNARAEWRKFTMDGHQKYLDLVREIEKGLRLQDRVALASVEHMMAGWYGWYYFQRLRMNISTDRTADTDELQKWVNIGLENDDVDGYNLASLSELFYLSKDCGKAKAHIDRGIELGGTVDIYNSGGIVNLICGDLENAKKNLKRALSLAPNDQGWFVTSQLVVTLYQLGEVDEIKELIFEKIDYIDMPAHTIAIYAAIQIDDNNFDEAKKYLEVANKKGLTETSIFRHFFKPKPAKEFIEKISPYLDIKKN
ncbi:hypothetical protein OA343_00100 [Paracoccaceae bacterium]|nr:hypothetical protein [Paracoccaceae bacterium]